MVQVCVIGISASFVVVMSFIPDFEIERHFCGVGLLESAHQIMNQYPGF